MAYIKYTGSITNRSLSIFRIDIIDTEKESIAPATEIKIQGLNLSRSEIAKTDSIASGSLDITLLSETNYQFINLYTANQFQYKVKLYQDDILIWSGHLDPEVYEEPYNYSSGYSVSITATDLGILKRNKLTITGIVSIFDIIKNAIEVSRLSFHKLYVANTVGVEMIIVQYPFLDHMYIQMSNFGDKTGFTILEEVLKAFGGLKMIYISGNIYISDFDTIIQDCATYCYYDNSLSNYEWELVHHRLKDFSILGRDAKLSMLPTYSNANLEYKLNPLNNMLVATHGVDWNIEYRHQSVPVPENQALKGFDLFTYVDSGSKTLQIMGDLQWVKLVPYHSSANCSGAISYNYKTRSDIVVLKNKIEPYITPNKNYRLRIQLKVLLSVSNNPFEPSSLKNEEGNNKRFKDRSNIIFFFGNIYLKNHEGEVTHYYRRDGGFSRWEKAEGTPKTKWYEFAFYTHNRKSDTPAGQLMTNSPCIWPNNSFDISSFAKENMGKGDVILLPPVPGTIEINVYDGFLCYDYGMKVRQDYRDFKWLIYNSIHIDVEDALTGNPVENEDIVYQCRINDYAKDEYNDTLSIGSNIDLNPSSQSSIFKKVDGAYQIETKFKKNRKTLPLEAHLISSLFSNFADKQIKITTSCIPNMGFGFHIEKGIKMIKLKSNWDIVENKESVVLAEFHESNYNVSYE